MPTPLDIVELRVATDSWEAGTIGTVVEASAEGLLVEISDDEGRTLDVIALPQEAVRPVDLPDQKRLHV